MALGDRLVSGLDMDEDGEVLAGGPTDIDPIGDGVADTGRVLVLVLGARSPKLTS